MQPVITIEPCLKIGFVHFYVTVKYSDPRNNTSKQKQLKPGNSGEPIIYTILEALVGISFCWVLYYVKSVPES